MAQRKYTFKKKIPGWIFCVFWNNMPKKISGPSDREKRAKFLHIKMVWKKKS